MPGFNVGSGRDNLQPSVGGSDLNRASRWRIKSLVLGSGSDVNYLSVLSRQDLLFAKNLTLPTYSVDEESVLGGSINYKIAKTVVWDDVKVTFYDLAHKDDANSSILGQIYKARQRLWTPENGLRPASEYKGESTFILTDGDGNPTWSFTLINSYIKNISHSELSYESSAIKEVTLTLSYDWAVESGDTGNDSVLGYKFRDKPIYNEPFRELIFPSETPLGKSVPKDNNPGKKGPISPAKERAEKAKAEQEARWSRERASKAALNTEILIADAQFRR